jgi:acylphosphatase
MRKPSLIRSSNLAALRAIENYGNCEICGVKHLKIRVQGKVQGVFYRASAKQMAQLLGVKGFVRNEADGDVYIEAEEEEHILTKFIQWCHHGPQGASVSYVSVTEGSLENFTAFEIKRDHS